MLSHQRRSLFDIVRFGGLSLLALALLGSGFGEEAEATHQYVVDQNHDDGSSGTFRWALEQANSDGGPSSITFQGVDEVWLNPTRGTLAHVTAPDLTVDGRTAPGGEVSLRFEQQYALGGLFIEADRVSIYNLAVLDSHDGVLVLSANDVVLDGVESSRGAGERAGFTVVAAVDGNFARCRSVGNSAQGMLFHNGCVGNQIGPDNEILSNTGTGIVLNQDAYANDIFSNEILSNGSGGVGVYTSMGNQIGPSNTIAGNDKAGVTLDTGGNTVTGNRIHRSGTHGILGLAGADETIITGNILLRNTFAGILLNQAASCVISANIVAWCEGHFGIALDGVTDSVIGPGNLVGVNHLGGMLIDSCDPTLITGNTVMMNLGPGILVQSDKIPTAQDVVEIASCTVRQNRVGILLANGAANVDVRACTVMQNIGSGITVSTDANAADRDAGHVIRQSFIAANTSFGIACFWSGGLTVRENVIGGHDGAGLTLQNYADGTLLLRNLITVNGVGVNLVRADGALLDGNQIVQNYGSGVFAGETTNDFVNNLFAQNELVGLVTGRGGSGCRVIHNTFAGNGAGLDGGGYLRNNIFWDNDSVDLVHDDALDVDHCSIQSYLCGSPSGSNNMSADPLFVDANGGDFHLSAGSPMLEAANPSVPQLSTTDFDGDDRIIDGAPDLGCDEYAPSGALSWQRDRWNRRSLARVWELRDELEKVAPSARTRFGTQGANAYVVTNLDDSGEGSLREAMNDANRDYGPSIITFQSGLSGTIWAETSLPALTDTYGGTTIVGPLQNDGTTPAIRVELMPGTVLSAFAVQSANNTVANLILDATYDAVVLQGLARFNLFENVWIENTDHGLGFGLYGADSNTFRRCRSTSHQDAGFFVAFRADGNVFEDCVASGMSASLGMTIVSSRNNIVRGTSASQKTELVGNRWGLSVKYGSSGNVIGPHVSIEDSGQTYAGLGIFMTGAITSNNEFRDLEVRNTAGTGIGFYGHGESNRFLNVTVTQSTKWGMDFHGSKGTTIEGGEVSGPTTQSQSLLSLSDCSDDSTLDGVRVVASGVANAGIQISGSQSVSVLDCEVLGTYSLWGSGISFLDGADSGVATGNTVGQVTSGGPDRGVLLSGVDSCTVSSNTIYVGDQNGNANDAGVQIGDAHACTIGPDNLIQAITSQATYGVLATNSSGAVTELSLRGNQILGEDLMENGAHLFSVGADAVVDGNDIVSCWNRGIMVSADDTLRLQNNLIRHCGTGLSLPWSTFGVLPIVMFNTVVCNDVGIRGEGRLWFNNSWSNSSGDVFAPGAEIHANNLGSLSGVPADNLSVDPLFVSFGGCGAGNADYHLSSSSPLKNFSYSGTPPTVPSLDVDGQGRLAGSSYDLGYDEAH